MRIIDADGHVAEGASLAVQAMQRWPRHIAPRTDGLGLVIEGRQYPEPTGPGAGCPIDHGLTTAPGLNCRTPAGVVGDAERDHIDAMVLYPSLGLCTPTLRDPGFAAGFARFYNQWLADYCATAPGRLYGVAVTPIEMGATAIEIMREAKDLGLVATHVPPGLRSKNLDHPDLDAFYAAAVDLDMPLGIHGAAGMNMPKIGVDRFTNYVQVHSIGSPFDQMSAMTSLVSGGVFDRHPGLRVAFLDAGAGWLPYFIDRLRSHFVKRGDWIEGGWRRDPYDYLAAGNIWVTCAAGEPLLSGVIDVLGEDFLMFASHYPLWSGDWPESTKPLRGRGDLSDSARRKVGARNAARFYRLD
ncbi:amidohydrolase [Mycolicibacterium flavescens]|uniref:2-amino-3-carboxymuconate-6-semialdehyde decarboxylase n=1 Tax=Mycolicibacterium flavescens TaxID=1776 RepID=A0A1E3RAU5_MYCFV|nr:amidohydrolase family protein [Mycolicibacterium flavescens]MCV7279154.1 amidohydrolase [Mycolicibacterium flavescens]ODQ86921.1 2-amino-3-carboxymuconate-6-semialdehyde decarboxylase [Mycolicibacterium flavescens]